MSVLSMSRRADIPKSSIHVRLMTRRGLPKSGKFRQVQSRGYRAANLRVM